MLIEAVNDASGAGARLLGAAETGEVDAGFVEWPDGGVGVLTRSDAPVGLIAGSPWSPCCSISLMAAGSARGTCRQARRNRSTREWRTGSQRCRGTLRRWWAHMSLRQVDWTIRHDYPTPEIEHYLAFRTHGLDALEAGEALSTADLIR